MLTLWWGFLLQLLVLLHFTHPGCNCKRIRWPSCQLSAAGNCICIGSHWQWVRFVSFRSSWQQFGPGNTLTHMQHTQTHSPPHTATHRPTPGEDNWISLAVGKGFHTARVAKWARRTDAGRAFALHNHFAYRLRYHYAIPNISTLYSWKCMWHLSFAAQRTLQADQKEYNSCNIYPGQKGFFNI